MKQRRPRSTDWRPGRATGWTETVFQAQRLGRRQRPGGISQRADSAYGHANSVKITVEHQSVDLLRPAGAARCRKELKGTLGVKGDTGSLVGIMVKMGDMAFGSRILRISRYGRTGNETAKASINRLEAGAGDRVDGDCIPGPMPWPSPASRWDLPTGGLGVWTHELGQDHRRASER
jgi:hypothetical protein